MNLLTPIKIPAYTYPIDYNSRLFLIGSCFTAHIGERLHQYKFPVLHNSTGIVFDAGSIATQLDHIIKLKTYTAADLFKHNGLWNCWFYHSDFSNPDSGTALHQLNQAIQVNHFFLKKATHLIITIGTAWSYQLKENGMHVANCHKVPQTAFTKVLSPVSEMTAALQQTINALLEFNPELQILLTVSPVRHIRDGLVENNRSKARVLETVHTLCENNVACTYFPAYELVIDVLRDYRWYASDLAHPNHAAVDFVFDHFSENCITPQARQKMELVKQVHTAMHHKPRFPETEEHLTFKNTMLEQVKKLTMQYPDLNWQNELTYFST